METLDYKDSVNRASKSTGRGESEQHLNFKNFIAKHPEILQLPGGLTGRTEYPLPSGDSLDVFFEHKDEWIGVEVKSQLSPASDIIRGIFQCIKYRAVIEACQVSQELPKNARAVLVLESALLEELVPLKNILGVEVLDNVKPK